MNNQHVQAALARLYMDLKDPLVFDLPIIIVDANTSGFGVAANFPDGIHITEQALLRDPHNLHVYLAHEILHDVVMDHTLFRYSADRLNKAYDYFINLLMYDAYGYDARKCYFRGLFEQKYTGKTVREIVNSLPDDKEYIRYTHSVRHPTVIRIAQNLRKSLDIKAVEYSVLAPSVHVVDSYYQHLRKHYDSMVFDKLPGIDQESVFRSLWLRCFCEDFTYNHRSFEGHLSNTQVLSVVPKIDNAETMNDPELSMFYVAQLLNFLNASGRCISALIARHTKRIHHNKDLLAHLSRTCPNVLERRAKRARIKRSIKAAQEKIAKLQKMPQLHQLLESRNRVAVKRHVQKIANLSSRLIVGTDRPRFDRSHETVRMIWFLQKNMKALLDVFNTYHQMKKLTSQFADDSGENEDDDDGGGSSDVENLKDKLANGNGDGEDDDDSDGDSDSDSSGKKDSNSKGNGKGKNRKLETLDVLSAHRNLFASILNHAADFGEKLASNNSSKYTDGLRPLTLNLGTDLPTVLDSEIGRLGNEYTKLSFLVDLANGNLLQHRDFDPRRSPLVFVLDCSGSMGSCYDVAAGFVLCMIMKLQHMNRSCALVKFSSTVTEVFVFTKKVSLPNLLRALVPDFGGTNFDEALLAAYKVIKQYGWHNAQTLLVSDGHDKISPSVVESKPENTKTTAVLVSGKVKLPGVDDCVLVKRNKLALELTRIGNSVL